jgi:hypothetical protein
VAEKTTFARAVKFAETGSFDGNYKAVRGRVRNGRLVGAYGIASDEWDRLAEEAGYMGAAWRDPKAQDAVAQATFDALYSKYGDWRLVAIAWKAGEAVADVVRSTPSVLETEGMAPVREYATQVMRYAREDMVVSPGTDGESPNREVFSPNTRNIVPDGLAPGASKARPVLTGMLRAMRDRQRGLVPPTEPDEELA